MFFIMFLRRRKAVEAIDNLKRGAHFTTQALEVRAVVEV